LQVKETEPEGYQAALRAKEAKLQACEVKLIDGLNTKGAERKELRERQDPLAVMLTREAELENCQVHQHDHENALHLEEAELRPHEDALLVELEEKDKGHTLNAETTTGRQILWRVVWSTFGVSLKGMLPIRILRMAYSIYRYGSTVKQVGDERATVLRDNRASAEIFLGELTRSTNIHVPHP
jgi:hypothetical protein